MGRSILMPLIVCTVIAVSAGLAWDHAVQKTVPVGFVVGALVFCLLISVFALRKIFSNLRKLERLEQGIRSYESAIQNRLNKFETNTPDVARIDLLESRITAYERKTILSNDPHNIDANAAYRTERANVLFSESRLNELIDGQNENVVRLRPSIPKQLSTFTKTSKPALKKQRKLIKNIKLDDIRVRLQPTLSLDTRAMLGFEVTACVEHKNGEIIEHDDIKSNLTTPKRICDFDRQIIDKTIALIRALRRQNKSPVLFAQISCQSIKSTTAFEAFEASLKSNKAIRDYIIWEISQDELDNMSKVQKERLRKIRETGFGLGLTQCNDPQVVIEAIKGDTFSFVKFDISTLEDIEAGDEAYRGIEMISACRKMDTTIIVTHIEKERQLVSLIDRDIEFAQGNLFSAPKFPNLETGSNKKIIKQ